MTTIERQPKISVEIQRARLSLQKAAKTAGLIPQDGRIVYEAGSRTYDTPPAVIVLDGADRPLGRLEILPEFTHLTRAREVVVSMDTAAVTLHRLLEAGLLP